MLLDINMAGRSGLELPALLCSEGQRQLQGVDQRPAHRRLSVCENQIMLMRIKGVSLADLGVEMLISVKTVSTQRSHILDKPGLGSNLELVLYAVRQGLLR